MIREMLAIVALFALGGVLHAADSPVRIADLTAEHEKNPIGIGATAPRFSWKLVSDRLGEAQTAYEIRAAATPAGLNEQPGGTARLWSTGKVASEQSLLIPWSGTKLTSRAQVYWQVRVWDKEGNPTAWSDAASIEMGLLDPQAEWKGQWITADLPRYDIVAGPLAKASWINAGSTAAQAAAARYALALPANAKVVGASLDATGDGLISLFVNGQAIRQGASSHTGPFHAEFGGQLVTGRNVIALASAAVRNAGRGRGPAGKNALAAHGVIMLDNGDRVEFDTDGTWKAAVAPAGEWFTPAFDDSTWPAATVLGPYAAAPATGSADGTIGPGRYLRKAFTAKGPVAKARLYATALGTYEASINGKPVSADQLAPGWTDYTQRVMVQAYDVTGLITPGQNALGAILTDGWFAGRLGWMGLAQYAQISSRPLFAAQLEITYADGTTETIATGDSWKGGAGEIVGSDQQLGEVIDLRKAAPWDQASFSDAAWAAVKVQDDIHVPLVPRVGPPVRKLMELPPQKIARMGNTWIVDFGQNLVGHIRLTAWSPARGVSPTITVQHGEMLNPDGTLYVENLRPALSIDTFTLKGTGRPEILPEPRFTFHGFRYVQIAGFPGELKPDDIRAIVVGSDTPPTGTFECSNADVNRLYQNIVWAQRGNFLSVPTDCPQRDERMGWMGDAQVFAPTAAMNADVASFFAKWMVDVNDGQLTAGPSAGAYSDVSPRVARPAAAWPVWGDAGVIIPWDMYAAYGDRAFLEDNYAHMAAWVDFSRQRSRNFLQTGGVGDHLAPEGGRGAPAQGPATAGAPASAPGRGRGPGFGGVSTTAVVDTAYFAHAAQLVAKSAAVLGKAEDAAKYDKLFHDIAAAFNQAYVQADGTIQAGTQTTYILALQFDLLPENLRPAAAKHLADDVQTRGHLTTGFVGVGLINPALTAIGRPDLAYQLLLTDTYPSWLFPIKQGATTIWERWDGYTPERGFQDSAMNSFNHYSLGSVGQWLYSGVGGIRLDEAHPGYKHFALQPQITSKLAFAKVTFNSPYGLISSHWHLEGNQYAYDAVVPPNTTADLTLPVAPPGYRLIGEKTVLLPAGAYHFAFPAESLK